MTKDEKFCHDAWQQQLPSVIAELGTVGITDAGFQKGVLGRIRWAWQQQKTWPDPPVTWSGLIQRAVAELSALIEIRTSYLEELLAFAKARAAGHVAWQHIPATVLDELERSPEYAARHGLSLDEPAVLLAGLLVVIEREVHRAKYRDVLLFCLHFNRAQFRSIMQRKARCTDEVAECLLDDVAEHLIRQSALYSFERSHIDQLANSPELQKSDKKLNNLCLLKIGNIAANWRKRIKKPHSLFDEPAQIQEYIDDKTEDLEVNIINGHDHQLRMALLSFFLLNNPRLTEDCVRIIVKHYTFKYPLQRLAMDHRTTIDKVRTIIKRVGRKSMSDLTDFGLFGDGVRRRELPSNAALQRACEHLKNLIAEIDQEQMREKI